MTYLVLAEMQLAISAAYVRLFIRSISMSFSFLMSIFLKPDLSMCLVFLSCLLPILGSRTLPLKRLLTAESTPLCFLQDLCTKANATLVYLTCDRARKVRQSASMKQREPTRFQGVTRTRDG